MSLKNSLEAKLETFSYFLANSYIHYNIFLNSCTVDAMSIVRYS